MNLLLQEDETIQKDLPFIETKKSLGEISKKFTTETQKGHVIRLLPI